jgi:hypothetical protein
MMVLMHRINPELGDFTCSAAAYTIDIAGGVKGACTSLSECEMNRYGATPTQVLPDAISAVETVGSPVGLRCWILKHQRLLS